MFAVVATSFRFSITNNAIFFPVYLDWGQLQQIPGTSGSRANEQTTMTMQQD